MQNNNGFEYTYSAKEQAELNKIRAKYEVREENKMERLRKLDRGVTKKATALALIFGIFGALTLGMGMSLIMTDFSEILGSYRDIALPIGIIVGAVGGVFTCLAYPVYNLAIKAERKRIAPEIIRLTDELMK